MPSEFDLIRRFFTHPAPGALLGVGDDAALLAPAPGTVLAVSADMLVAGRHFTLQDDPAAIGHKTLAVNLSDMAAMGALPRWALLSLALPEADEAWLGAFATGFLSLAARFGVDLVGGDTTRGPLTLSVQILGEVPPEAALRRDGARPGDEIWVSGVLGSAAVALAARQGRVALAPEELAVLAPALDRPEPRVALGLALRGLAHAAIDLSDGLLADLGHILERSGVGAEVAWERLPTHPAVAARLAEPPVRRAVLAGGDDYELCFTAPADARPSLLAWSREQGLPLTPIGRIVPDGGLTLLEKGKPVTPGVTGFDHFA